MVRFRRRTGVLIAMFFVMALACDKPAVPKAARREPPPAAPEQAKTPQLIEPAAEVTPTPAPSEKEAYQVTLDHVLMFDPRMGPINAELAAEPGVHLLVAGRIRNGTGRLLHRAKVYATLVARFGERTEIEHHSGGLGFVPNVNSVDPWRPDTERTFQCLTRPLDPIYLEITPQKIDAALTLTTQDPLAYRFRGEIDRFPVSWEPVLGISLLGRAVVAADGNAYLAPQERDDAIAAQTAVRVLYQRGAAFKIVGPDGRLMWVRYDQLRDLTTEPLEPGDPHGAADPVGFPIAVRTEEGLNIAVTGVAELDGNPGVEGGKVYRVELAITNTADRTRRTPALRDFALDLAAGAYAQPRGLKRRAKGTYDATSLGAGKTINAVLSFNGRASERTFPFDLELHRPREKPMRWPLLPTLLANQRQNGARP